MRRLIVARAPYWDAERKELTDVPARVGVYRWSHSGDLPDVTLDPALGNTFHFITVVVKTVAALDPVAVPSPVPAPRAMDFVPHKLATDVLLTGSAKAGTLRVRVGAVSKSVQVADGADLAAGVRDHAGASVRTGAAGDLGTLSSSGAKIVAAEWAKNQQATPALQVPWPRGDEELSVETGEGTTVAGRLPGRVPFARLVSRTEAPDRLVEMCLDTIELDLPRGALVLTYRGVGAMQRADGRDLDRVDIVWWPADEAFVFALAEAEIPRATIEHAWEPEDLERGELPPPLGGDEFAAARYETWDVEHGPLPTMTIERVTRIAAELGEQREPRERVLSRHGLEPYAWDVEERAWSQSLAEADLRNDDDDRPSLGEAYAEHYLAAQDALARPEEAEWTARDYARVTAAMDVDEPARVLVEQRVTLGEYQRLDRRMQKRAAAEPAFAAELGTLLDGERAKAQAAKRERRREAGKAADEDEEDDDE